MFLASVIKVPGIPKSNTSMGNVFINGYSRTWNASRLTPLVAYAGLFDFIEVLKERVNIERSDWVIESFA